MSKLKAPRGTQDILAEDSKLWQKIEAEAIRVFAAAGFEEIRTPIFESTELFSRAVGEDSDIVNKEMYSFTDKSDRSLTLRPEATAAIVRAYNEHSLERAAKPQKLWYRGPMFRYERPQTGRYRQFHQIGIEAIGSKPPYIDLEIIQVGMQLLSNLGLNDLTLYINSLGNQASREAYTKALKDFLASLQNDVCEDCQRRYQQNPLRALDCKQEADQKLYQAAPSIQDYLDEESQEIWSAMLQGLDKLAIKYIVDPKLVRGLDYYSHAVFEIKTTSKELAGQNTVLGGGRYDKLVKELGGQESPAVGWALGLERLASLIKSPTQTGGLYIISDSAMDAQILATKLRQDTDNSITIDYDYNSSKFNKQLEKAIKRSYDWALFYMEDERSSGKFKLKNLRETVEYNDLDYDAVIARSTKGDAL